MARKYKLRGDDKVAYCDPFIEAEGIANSATMVILDFSSSQTPPMAFSSGI